MRETIVKLFCRKDYFQRLTRVLKFLCDVVQGRRQTWGKCANYTIIACNFKEYIICLVTYVT